MLFIHRRKDVSYEKFDVKSLLSAHYSFFLRFFFVFFLLITNCNKLVCFYQIFYYALGLEGFNLHNYIRNFSTYTDTKFATPTRFKCTNYLYYSR